MNAIKKACGLLFLFMALQLVNKAEAQGQVNYNVGYFTYDGDQFNLALSDADYYGSPPAYEIISSNTLSSVVEINLFSIYDSNTASYISAQSITIDDGQATNYSTNGGTVASFQLAVHEYIRLRVEFWTSHGSIYKYVSFYRDL